MDFENVKIFGKKSYSDLLKEIYENSKNKEAQIKILIKELQPLIKDSGDATIIVPLIKEYLEIAVKNDEHLIKMAAIVQRSMNNNGSSKDDVGLSESERNDLIELANNMAVVGQA
jgi:hypothetical protein